MSAYDDMLIRMGQPDEADESDEQIAEAVKASRNIGFLMDREVSEREKLQHMSLS